MIITDIEKLKLTFIITDKFTFDVNKQFRDGCDKIDNKIRYIDIDLKNCTYMDSSSLGMLLILLDKSKANNISNSSKEVRKILEIANFDRLFKIV